MEFTVPQEEELSVEVIDLEGKETFSRYFERFGGQYSETIDLSNQKKGVHLLEIRLGKKRLTKKINVK